MANKLSNISTHTYREVLLKLGCKKIGINSGHENWTRQDLHRPITFQTHIEPIPERIIRQCFIPLGIDKKMFLKILNSL